MKTRLFAFTLLLLGSSTILVEAISRGTEKIITDDGYTVEKHQVVTSDGYVLSLFRIPGYRTTPVFLQHGLLCSSADWVILGPGRSLAYLLADAGYDVWLGNARGNTNSRQHVTMDPKKAKFWDFSWHEIGLLDLPAMIDYVLEKTGQQSLHYAGHSQGTTSFFVMASLRPEYNGKIRSMHALAPVAFMGHLRSPFIRAFAPFANQIEWTMGMLGVTEFLPSNKMMALGGQKACEDSSVLQEACVNALFLVSGYDSAQTNRTMLPAILENTPAGASVKQFIHFAQGINSGRFRQYDLGIVRNLMEYGSVSPPSYPLNRISAPVFLHYGDNDWLASVTDVGLLHQQLGDSAQLLRVPDNRWNHLDFTYGNDAKHLLYDRIIELMGQHE
ncbi:lipase 3-like [Ochlerotatus camptorhynchus]|uniref:lipase 3-like n=1 Tax=Ochlerotatus camptorhynchus TaxID=644619 RepID=UPI0031E2941B